MSENLRGLLTLARQARSRRAASALGAAWLAAEHGHFLPWLAVFMGIGNILFFAESTMPAAWIGPLLLALSGLLLPLAWRRLLPRAAALCLCFLALGFAAASLRTHALPPLTKLPRAAAMVEGRVVTLEPLPRGRRVLLSAVSLDQGSRLPRGLRIRLKDSDTTPLRPGEEVRLRALLSPPYPPSYPGGWDQRRDAFFTGLGGLGFALGPVQRVAASAAARLGWGGFWQGMRERVSRRIIAEIPGPAGAVAATLLTGIRSALPYADRRAFSVTGLTHILAVAGLHIGIVMMTIFAAVRLSLACWPWLALRMPVKEAAAIAALVVGAFYMMMTGMHLPIFRSFIMASLVTLGLLAGRQAISMRSLALAAMLLLLVQPEALAGVSFQMSFSAVLVLIAGYDWLRRRKLGMLAHRPGLLGFLRRDLSFVTLTSLLAALATAPFAAYHFGQIELYSIPANILAVPITAFWVLPLGLFAYLLLPLHLGFLALVPMGWGCAAILGIARLGAALPAATLPTGGVPLFCLGLTGFGVLWLCLWGSAARLLGLLPLALGLVLPPLLARAPDVLISPDLRMLAFAVPGAVLLEGKRPEAFTLEEWQRFWGGRPLLRLPAEGAVRVPGRSGAPAALCSADGCLLPRRGADPVLLWRAADPPGSCAGFSLVILAAIWHRPYAPGCARVAMLTRASVWAGGATALSFRAGGIRLRADRPPRGSWPWLPVVALHPWARPQGHEKLLANARRANNTSR
ncbi:ComEC/Rec2 family competence protein [Acidisoma sp. C75]